MGTSYKYKTDGGYDFFVNGNMASYQDYKNAGGQDPKPLPEGAVVQQISDGSIWFSLDGKLYQDDGNQTIIVRDDFGGTEGNPSEGTPTTTTGGATTSEETFKPTPYMGKIYYTAEDLANAVTQHIQDVYKESVALIENQFKQGFISIDERDDQIKKTRQNLIKKKADDLQSISGYMNAISPDAIQSGRGKLEAQAVEDYTTQNKTLGSELGAGLYDANGRIRQDLTTAELSPYMTELSDTGNLARSIVENRTNKETALNKAASDTNQDVQANAYDYINNTPKGSNYTNYLNSNILNKQVTAGGATGPAIVKKTDRYGNPIDEYINR
jgi:hypothetical protein